MRTDVTLSLHQKKRNVSSALDEAGVRVVLKENGKPNMHYFMCMLDGCYREGREGTVVKLDKNGGTSNGSCHLKNAHEVQSERTKKMKRNSDECHKVRCLQWVCNACLCLQSSLPIHFEIFVFSVLNIAGART